MAFQFSFEKLNEFILQCGSIHESYRFCTNALEQLAKLIPFDQGRIYFLNEQLAIFDEYLIGVNPSVTKDYREYYSKLDGSRYAISSRHSMNKGIPGKIDWTLISDSEQFVREHLRPQKIHYSTGIQLPDLNGTPKVLFCMDRTGNVQYSDAEIEALKFLCAHLSNLYQNFYASNPGLCHSNSASKTSVEQLLTRREKELLPLLLQGLTAQLIADKLVISSQTVLKHISHIYEKLEVRSRVELFGKILSEYPLQRL